MRGRKSYSAWRCWASEQEIDPTQKKLKTKVLLQGDRGGEEGGREAVISCKCDVRGRRCVRANGALSKVYFARSFHQLRTAVGGIVRVKMALNQRARRKSVKQKTACRTSWRQRVPQISSTHFAAAKNGIPRAVARAQLGYRQPMSCLCSRKPASAKSRTFLKAAHEYFNLITTTMESSPYRRVLPRFLDYSK